MSDPASDDVDFPWRLLQRGEFAQAIALFREQYVSERSPGRRRGQGEALLWAKEYRLASEHFRESIARDQGFRASSEEDFVFLGAAEWCLGEYESAIRAWQHGVKALGSIGGARTHSPLLLLVASILKPQLFLRARAERMLLQRLQSPRTQFWPASLASYVAGRIDDKTLEESWTWYVAQGIRGMTSSSKWIIEFYNSLLAFEGKTISRKEFQLHISSLVDQSRVESCDLENFIQLTWQPEFYIARHEAASIDIDN